MKPDRLEPDSRCPLWLVLGKSSAWLDQLAERVAGQQSNGKAAADRDAGSQAADHGYLGDEPRRPGAGMR